MDNWNEGEVIIHFLLRIRNRCWLRNPVQVFAGHRIDGVWHQSLQTGCFWRFLGVLSLEGCCRSQSLYFIVELGSLVKPIERLLFFFGIGDGQWFWPSNGIHPLHRISVLEEVGALSSREVIQTLYCFLMVLDGGGDGRWIVAGIRVGLWLFVVIIEERWWINGTRGRRVENGG